MYCLWNEDAEGIWHTDCKNTHKFFVGGPKDNKYFFCPYCGEPLTTERKKRKQDDKKEKAGSSTRHE